MSRIFQFTESTLGSERGHHRVSPHLSLSYQRVDAILRAREYNVQRHAQRALQARRQCERKFHVCDPDDDNDSLLASIRQWVWCVTRQSSRHEAIPPLERCSIQPVEPESRLLMLIAVRVVEERSCTVAARGEVRAVREERLESSRRGQNDVYPCAERIGLGSVEAEDGVLNVFIREAGLGQTERASSGNVEGQLLQGQHPGGVAVLLRGELGDAKKAAVAVHIIAHNRMSLRCCRSMCGRMSSSKAVVMGSLGPFSWAAIRLMPAICRLSSCGASRADGRSPSRRGGRPQLRGILAGAEGHRAGR